jgi:serine/threonine protein kinase
VTFDDIDNHQYHQKSHDSSAKATHDDVTIASMNQAYDEIVADGAIAVPSSGSTSAVMKRALPKAYSRECISMIDLLGSGAFGEVGKAELDESIFGGSPGYLVAVKQVKKGAPASARQALLKEAILMAQFSGVKLGHPHVLSLIGLVEDSVGPTLAIVAYCENGSLLSFLKKDGYRAAVDSQFPISMGQQVASAMAFLASRGVVHRDLAARNVLLDSRKLARVSDFGLARQGAADTSRQNAYAVYNSSDAVALPIRWTAPEVLESMRFNTPSDVWAFAMMMIEVFTFGKRPFPKISNDAVYSIVLSGAQPQQPKHCTNEVYALLQSCWSMDARDRPSFEKIEAQFDGFYKSAQSDGTPGSGSNLKKTIRKGSRRSQSLLRGYGRPVLSEVGKLGYGRPVLSEVGKLGYGRPVTSI